MRSVEKKIDISENRKDDFRHEIMNYIGALAIEGKTFDHKVWSKADKEAAGISMKKTLVRFTLILSGEGPLDLADLENMAAVILGQAQAYARGEWDTWLDSTCLACMHRPGLTYCTQEFRDEQPRLSLKGGAR